MVLQFSGGDVIRLLRGPQKEIEKQQQTNEWGLCLHRVVSEEALRPVLNVPVKPR